MIDISDQTVIRPQCPDMWIEFGSCHADVVLCESGRYLFSANYYGGTVSRIDLEDDFAEQTVYVGPWPGDLDITPDKTKILVKVGTDGSPGTSSVNDKIVILDCSTFSIICEVPLNDEASRQKIGFSCDNTRAFVTANKRQSDSAMLYEISLEAPCEIIRTLPIPGNDNPDWGWLGVAASCSNVFVSDYLNSQVLVIDQASLTVGDTIPLSYEPGVLGITSDKHYLYALSSPDIQSDSSFVSIINLTSNSITKELSLPNPRAHDIEFSLNGTRAYISHNASPDGAVTVLSLANEFVTYEWCAGDHTGNVDYDSGCLVDVGDLTRLISCLYIQPDDCPDCMAEANIDGDDQGLVDIGDLTALISYLYIPPNPLPADCP
jgi:DNA-binding beta-propeller fold protein YncE